MEEEEEEEKDDGMIFGEDDGTRSREEGVDDEEAEALPGVVVAVVMEGLEEDVAVVDEDEDTESGETKGL